MIDCKAMTSLDPFLHKADRLLIDEEILEIIRKEKTKGSEGY